MKCCSKGWSDIKSANRISNSKETYVDDLTCFQGEFIKSMNAQVDNSGRVSGLEIECNKQLKTVAIPNSSLSWKGKNPHLKIR